MLPRTPSVLAVPREILVNQSRKWSRTRRVLCRATCCVAVLSLGLGSLAHAQSSADNEGWSAQREGQQRPAAAAPATNDSDRQAARALLDAGTIAFRQLRYEDALENFQQAYKLTHDPLLLFNIGLTYERLFRLPEAVKALEGYLAAMPDAPNRPAAEERIRVMREHIDQTPAAPPPPPQPVVEATPDDGKDQAPADRGTRVLPTWAFWSGLGATAVLGGVTIWSGVDTLNTKDEFDKDPSPKKRDEGEQAELRTNVLIGTTGVLAAATVVIGVFFTDWSGGSSTEGAQARLAPWLDGHSAGLSATGSF
jgi:hypothetical protein